MLSDNELDVLSVMGDLIKVMVDASRDGLVSRPDAEEHIAMYRKEIAEVLQSHKTQQVPEK
jgi:sRNA-binding carbon storage regulator CsrA